MRYVIAEKSERDVLNLMKRSVREEAKTRLHYVQNNEVDPCLKNDAISWQFAAYILDRVVDIATKNGHKFMFKDIPDEIVASSFCASLGINREGLDYRPFEFVDVDDGPMADDEFEKWFSILWDAVWSDKDSRFNGKTIGETWNILESEENFPRERFRKELERRGYLKMMPEEEQHPPVQLNYHPNNMKECEETLKKVGWELIDVEPSGNHAKIRHCSNDRIRCPRTDRGMSIHGEVVETVGSTSVVSIRINDCIDFGWDEGSKSYAIRRHHACSAT